MMRNKTIVKSIALLLALVSLLCGCRGERDTSDATESSTVATTTVAKTADTAYESIPRFDSKGNQRLEFSFVNDPYSLQLNMPQEWDFKSDNGGYAIFRDGTEIGSIHSGESDDLSEWTEVKTDETADSGLLTNTYIERRGVGDNAEYRYRFCYYYAFGTTQRMATLIVKIEELDIFAENSLSISGFVDRLTTDSGIGALSDKVQATNIAILGNSFVSTSNIGAITRDMFQRNGKACNVDAISIGMANVSTYTGDASMMQKVREGYYDIIFICGLYSTSQISNLQALESACKQGNTTLVIFPAHNESAAAIQQAQKACPNLVCLNWKNEIDQLIQSKNISRWDFCIDDTYDHSKPLAGYVGAHMIYRAIYSSVPTVGQSFSIDQSYVNSLLGDYCATGTIPLSFKNGIKYLG